MGRFTRRKFLLGGSTSLLGAVCGHNFFASRSNASEEKTLGGVRLGEGMTYRIRHRVAVDVGTLPFSLLEIWLPLPLVDAEICPEQSVDSLKIEPKSRISFDSHKLARVANRAFGHRGIGQPRRTYSLEASYKVIVRSQLFDFELHSRRNENSPGDSVEKYKRDARYRLFTRSEKMAPTGHASIKSLVRQIKPSDGSPLEIARAYYDWVIDNVKYKKMEGFGGAIICLKDQCGECTDISALFVALCRASGIPARPVVGYWADKHNGWHCWAQFMLPGGQWLPVDCQMGGNGSFARRMHFGRTDNRRVALCKTFDIRLSRVAGKRRAVDNLQNGHWWWEAKHLPPKSPRPTGHFEVRGQAVSVEI